VSTHRNYCERCATVHESIDCPPAAQPAPQYDDALHMMEAQGGSFVKALAHLYCMADPANKAVARAAFAKYFESYEARYQQHVAARGAEVSA
jgi:hypothetical protein